MTDIDFATPNDREWLIQIADALDAAERIHPNIIRVSDELAQQIADGLRRISEGWLNCDRIQTPRREAH